MRIAAKWLFIICLPVLLLAASIAVTVNSLWLYEYGARKYGVSEELEAAGVKLSDAELNGVYAGLIGYFNSGEEYVQITVVKEDKPFDLFTREEVIHFRDVKGLIWLDYWVLLGMLVYFLGYIGLNLFLWKDRRRLARGLVGGSVFTLAVMLALVLLDTLMGFGQLWHQFHLVFFSNLFWSAPGYMLRLFTQGFFYDAVIFGAALVVVGALIIGGVGWWYMRRIRRAQ